MIDSAKAAKGDVIAKASPDQDRFHREAGATAHNSQNDFPGLRNIGSTCYLHADLQCKFHCEPLGVDVFNTPDMTGMIERPVRAIGAEYLASVESTDDVIAPIDMANELKRHVGFPFGRQQDAAECLRHLLQYTGLWHRHWDGHADLVDGSAVLSYTPELHKLEGQQRRSMPAYYCWRPRLRMEA